MVIFTSICANYIHKARILAKSVKEHINDAIFVVCLVEDSIPKNVNFDCFDRVILAKDAWEGNFKRFIFKHSIVEASTAVKGQFLKYLYHEYHEECNFLYLDPDIKVYSDFVELRRLLQEKPIVLCPHLLQPGNIDMELSSTAHGVYNLGFLAVSRSHETLKFINWWAERLYLFCYDDIINGIFTDQKWIDLVPCFFDVAICKHRGYNFAPWSLLDCGMYEENSKIYVKKDELRFIHFSGFGRSAEQCMAKWLPSGEHPFKILYNEYAAEHKLFDSDSISKTVWSYSVYQSGDMIDDNIREKYRKDYDIMFMNDNPFEKSNKYFANIFNTKKLTHDYSLYRTKIVTVYKKDGIKGVFRKIWSKLHK